MNEVQNTIMEMLSSIDFNTFTEAVGDVGGYRYTLKLTPAALTGTSVGDWRDFVLRNMTTLLKNKQEYCLDSIDMFMAFPVMGKTYGFTVVIADIPATPIVYEAPPSVPAPIYVSHNESDVGAVVKQEALKTDRRYKQGK